MKEKVVTKIGCSNIISLKKIKIKWYC